MNFDRYYIPRKHHHNQDTEQFHHPKVKLIFLILYVAFHFLRSKLIKNLPFSFIFFRFRFRLFLFCAHPMLVLMPRKTLPKNSLNHKIKQGVRADYSSFIFSFKYFNLSAPRVWHLLNHELSCLVFKISKQLRWCGLRHLVCDIVAAALANEYM